MGGRRVRGACEAEQMLAAVAATGVARAAWARANGVDARSLNVWRLNLERARASGERSEFVELVATSAPAVEPHEPYRVRVGEFVVEVGAAFDDDVLLRLLRVVVAC